VAVEQVEGVEEARFSYRDGMGHVTFDPPRTTSDEILEHLVETTRFEATVVDR